MNKGIKTAEEILYKHISIFDQHAPHEAILKAMEEYASQFFVSDKQGEESKTVWYISEDHSIATPYTHIVNHVKDGTFFSGSKEQCDEVMGIIEYIRAAAVSAPVEDKEKIILFDQSNQSETDTSKATQDVYCGNCRYGFWDCNCGNWQPIFPTEQKSAVEEQK